MSNSIAHTITDSPEHMECMGRREAMLAYQFNTIRARIPSYVSPHSRLSCYVPPLRTWSYNEELTKQQYHAVNCLIGFVTNPCHLIYFLVL
ncbi:uncharacterized protein LAJ45_08132 [Morchella importuna]|uniref:uncharacterized protein n=1 Tax=Morchella importuna TaxID=1174673 RepID=UPI001E8D4BDB|nr:uncharacterized protein LAJ45_08132 [Morchella importuna]KAH8147668.1 hypothetical protein LAJ45_08132 [Morchella importuna]